jgi:universal stress protein E
MSDLKKLLVGVDLLESRQNKLSPPVNEAVKQAIWLAERLSSEITFLAAVELPTGGEIHPIEFESERVASEVESSAREALGKLVEQTAGRGVRVTGKFADGQGWVELTREAIAGRHDLVLLGTRDVGAVRRALFGSTAVKLLHNCPGPIWVAKPRPHPVPTNLLVASDFSEVSDAALRLALQLALSADAKVHLVHVIEQTYARLWEAGLLETRHEELTHQKVRETAEKRLREQLARAAGPSRVNAEVCVAEGAYQADQAILKYIDAHRIDLLVMGTTARRGLAGVFLGNTAERLLTSLDCSLLAVKPAGFVCPVPLESYHHVPETVSLQTVDDRHDEP